MSWLHFVTHLLCDLGYINSPDSAGGSGVPGEIRIAPALRCQDDGYMFGLMRVQSIHSFIHSGVIGHLTMIFHPSLGTGERAASHETKILTLVELTFR